jgi:pyruvate,orthophosphate dikinase
VVEYFDAGIDAALDDAETRRPPTCQAVDRIMTIADERCAACGCAPTPTPRGRRPRGRMGSQGIGLCRTEHMFLGDRKQYVER